MTSKRTVLIVDDDSSIVQSLARQFRFLGFDVQTAAGPTDALEIATAQQVDLAVVDLILHDSWGIEVVAALRQLVPASRIVLCSGFASLPWVADVARTEAIRYVEKPTNARAILEAIGLEP